MRTTVRAVDDIPRTAGGKVRPVVSLMKESYHAGSVRTPDFYR
jgi:hypothetical protein